jgi:arylsulfatase A-like enzyme
MRGHLLLTGLFSTLIAGAAAGAIDVLWSWQLLTQYLPGLTGRLRLLLFLASAYALVGALLGPPLVAAGRALVERTCLGDLVRAAGRAHRDARARNPREALTGLALAITGPPVTALSLGTAHWWATRELTDRRHDGLVIASAMAATLAALAVAALVTLVVGRAVERGLAHFAQAGRRAERLTAPGAIAVALIALTAILAGAAAAITWDTLVLLPLRPAVIAMTALALAWPARVPGAAIATALTRRGRRYAMAAAPAALSLLLGAVVASGGNEAVRKAGAAYSGWGGPFTRGLRAASDLDGDGYSRYLGGGDCDDWDASIHPGALEIPGDGIDQNCIGGDPGLDDPPPDPRFVAPLPAGIPSDANVLLITIDTLRADHVGAYGYQRATTPVLDALANDGIVFRNAWAHAPSTRYSIPAILTGRYPLAVRYDHSVAGWPGLDERATTIAEIARDRGLYTGAILNYWYFDRQRRMDQGFDHYDNTNQRLHRPSGREGPAKTTGSSSREQSDKAIEFIGHNAHRRFFLWVHYYDPHYDYELHPDTVQFGNRDIDRYDHEIRYTDTHIGRVLDELRTRRLYDKTVVVVTGDHGEGFGEHGVFLHGYHLYAAQTRVPLIMRIPGTARQTVTMPTGHIDILPTIANLIGAPAGRDMQGRSLVDVSAGLAPSNQDRWIFQQLSYENNNEKRGAANQRCHVLFEVSPSTSWELYRIDQDPAETNDVIDNPGPCAGARRALELWYDRSELPSEATEALLAEPPSIAAPLDIDFGNEVRLLAVELPATVRAGDPIDLTFTFAARGRLPGDWRVFVHFEAPGGARFLGDHVPARPFAMWSSGQYIRYTHRVTVPRQTERGDYVVWTGLFRRNERRPARVAPEQTHVRISDDRAAIGVVRVQR